MLYVICGIWYFIRIGEQFDLLRNYHIPHTKYNIQNPLSFIVTVGIRSRNPRVKKIRISGQTHFSHLS